MRVLVIGATGMIGRPAVRQLLADGHQVTGLARDEGRAAVVAAQGATPVVGDLFEIVPKLTEKLKAFKAQNA